jgi:hypothetical protein
MPGSAKLDAFGETLSATFACGDDPPLALALLRLLAEGAPASTATLAASLDRPDSEVAEQVSRWRMSSVTRRAA